MSKKGMIFGDFIGVRENLTLTTPQEIFLDMNYEDMKIPNCVAKNEKSGSLMRLEY